MQTRPATPEEIIIHYQRPIKDGDRVSYRGFVRERAMRTARNGVQHIEHFRGKLVVENDVPFVVVAKSQKEPVAATVYIREDGTAGGILFDLRIKSKHLS